MTIDFETRCSEESNQEYSLIKNDYLYEFDNFRLEMIIPLSIPMLQEIFTNIPFL